MELLVIAGNVGRDAVLRRTQNDEAVLSFSLAVDRGKRKDGTEIPAAWYDCSIWGKRGEALERHIVKGTKLTLQGRPTAREHEGKVYMGITVDNLTFMGKPQGGQREEQRDSYGSGLGIDDDIPF